MNRSDHERGPVTLQTNSGVKPNRVRMEKAPPEHLTAEEFIKTEKAKSDIVMRETIVGFLLKAYGFALISTVIIIILQGFHLYGFTLNDDLVNKLGYATIGEVAGLLALTYKSYLGKGD